jgi:hypothetical protein
MSWLDNVVQFASVIASSLKKNSANETVDVLYHVEGIEGIEEDGLGERNEAGIWAALGIVSRPLGPDDDGKNAEVVCLRTADGLIPIATKDTRLRMQGSGPHEGTVALVGYGGGFHSLDPVGGDPQKGTIHVIYCPYNFNSAGVAQKAHVITLDPTSGNESITIVHAEGMAITMSKDKEILLKNATGSSTLTMGPNGITVTGQINLVGGVVIGNPLTALPLLAGVASPPCSTLFVSP